MLSGRVAKDFPAIQLLGSSFVSRTVPSIGLLARNLNDLTGVAFSLEELQMNHDMDDLFDYGDRVPIVPLERDLSYGGVPGLPDEELADPVELERQAFIADWWPILSLPVKSDDGGIRPEIDEDGHLNWGAFGTVDFERLHGPFDKARYKADKLEEDVRDAVNTLGMISARLPAETVNSIQARLRDDSFDIDDLEGADEYGFARFYSRIKRLRSEIRNLRQFSWEHRNAE